MNANLELNLNAGEELELKLAELLLNVLWHRSEVVAPVGSLETSWAVLVHQITDLAVEVVNVAFTKDNELEVDANLLLVIVLLLELGSLVLAA